MNLLHAPAVLLLCATVTLSAFEGKDPLAGYRDVVGESEKKNIFFEDFEHSKHRFKGFEVLVGEGVNGNRGLVLQRKPGDESYALAHLSVDLKPTMKYRFQVQYRIENFEGSRYGSPGVSFAGIEYYQEKPEKYLGGFYSEVPKKNLTGEWTVFSNEINTPPRFDSAKIVLYLSRKCTGKISFDNITISSAGQSPALIYPLMPKHLTIEPDGKLILRAENFNRGKNLELVARQKEHFTVVPIRNGRAALTLPEVHDGKNTLSLTIRDPEKKVSYGETLLDVYRRKAPPRVKTEADGSLRVDGKPFLPIGTFIHAKKTNHANLKVIADAGFNCILPYESINLHINGKNERSAKNISAQLDIIRQYGLKIIFEMYGQIDFPKWGTFTEFDGVRGMNKATEAAVNAIRNHPALLAWYISDENPLVELPAVRKLRNIISRNDPDHPVLTLTNSKANSIYFGPTGDIILADNYPLYDEKTHSIQPIRELLQKQKETGLGVWLVPQAFHWGVYRKGQFRFPSEEEMRSMILLGVNMGCKGFIFYSFHNPEHERISPGATKTFWPKVAGVAHLLKELEPFILLQEKGPAVRIQSTGKALIEAKAYRSAKNKKMILVITSDGPGKGNARIRIEGNPVLRSKYGHTVRQKNGEYLFSSENIASDILEEINESKHVE